jgi:hypothetical protein
MRKEQTWSCLDVTYRPLGNLKISFCYLEPSLTCLAVARAPCNDIKPHSPSIPGSHSRAAEAKIRRGHGIVLLESCEKFCSHAVGHRSSFCRKVKYTACWTDGYSSEVHPRSSL